MAAVTKVHVPRSEYGEPRCVESNDQEESEGLSGDGLGHDTSDEGEDDRDVEGWSDGEHEGGNESKANAGWAEAMAKILGKKPSASKATILLQNKELNKLKDKERQEQLDRKKQMNRKRAWEMMCREKPDVVNDRETERSLQKIATRGVVQLFNAVKKHQKMVNDKVKEVSGSERKKARILSSVSKKDFIDVLRKTEGGSGVTIKTEKSTAHEEASWSVLREDFMMGAAMKDWDKVSDGGMQESASD
ncbi:RRP15-like protein isoform X2 [Thalassophryne amazonica]|uniref:RRP15-like protein isoform X2 n=1 Tax=Thalassophryne amazonica TaxID=390379 RepID=UPI0014722EE4|nr:RRP15-like protein isoform X2 [Thalassophryne amazonica]